MKNLIKKFLSYLFVLYYSICRKKYFRQKKSYILFLKISTSTCGNVSIFNGAWMQKSRVYIEGNQNRIFIKGKVIGSAIEVHGNNNRILIAKGCQILNSIIVLRGEGCSFYIGEDSSFGGVRAVCMGVNNTITIGEKCMFSDHIEVWATDSHPIYVDNRIINSSTPILIKDRVWVGSRSIILKGVSIESDAIVGMASVVTKDINANTINVGNPAKCVSIAMSSWSREFIRV